jgi:hypothetical protein
MAIRRVPTRPMGGATGLTPPGRVYAALALGALAACGGPAEEPRREAAAAPAGRGAALARPAEAPLAAPVTALPGPSRASLQCARRMLARSPVMAEPAPIERGWRLRLRIYSSPPSGWIEKGSLLHDGARISYVPDGATRGLLDDAVRTAVRSVVEHCR